MIRRDHLTIVEYVIDTTNAVNVLADGMTRDRRGRPLDRNRLRLLLVGWMLAIGERRSATIADVHSVLTCDLPFEDQLRLGIREQRPDGTLTTLKIENLYSLIKRLDQALGYGRGKQPDLDDTERRRRHSVIQHYNDALMDVFDLGFSSTTFALDATGLWSWAKGKKTRSSTDPANDDIPTVDELDIDTNQTGSSTVGATDDSNSFDPDAGWGVKTSKNGREESFFGYHEHTLVRVPHRDQLPDAEPRLITRFELTAANNDIVDVSLRLLDRVRTPATDVVVDRHYHYKKVTRWLAELIRRGVRQHHDLRSDEHGFTEYQRMRFTAGHAHCPSTPDSLGNLTRPGPTDPPGRQTLFRQGIELRERYALKRHTALDESGTIRYQCPALDGRIGCPLRPGTVNVATRLGLPVIGNPPDPTIDNEPLPACCTQQSVRVTLPEPILKLAQPHYWGSKKWEREWNKRSAVEGTYGNRKNQSTENMRRGLHRHTGLTLTHLVVAVVNASYNLRILRNWHERTALGPSDHPLLAPVSDPHTFTLITWDEAIALIDPHADLDDLAA
jgi:hypothetical protein